MLCFIVIFTELIFPCILFFFLLCLFWLPMINLNILLISPILAFVELLLMLLFFTSKSSSFFSHGETIFIPILTKILCHIFFIINYLLIWFELYSLRFSSLCLSLLPLDFSLISFIVYLELFSCSNKIRNFT